MNLQQLLGTELPIIQAPMAGVQDSALAIAVSEAGGLGSLPCAMLGPDAMRQQLTAIRAGTNRPYNVNFFCHTPPVARLRARSRLAQDAVALTTPSSASTRPASAPVRAASPSAPKRPKSSRRSSRRW
jgi:NAD(P)H-dependent flavin oxidoreductase YrpB (nitropropane dioxygenase family)